MKKRRRREKVSHVSTCAGAHRSPGVTGRDGADQRGDMPAHDGCRSSECLLMRLFAEVPHEVRSAHTLHHKIAEAAHRLRTSIVSPRHRVLTRTATMQNESERIGPSKMSSLSRRACYKCGNVSYTNRHKSRERVPRPRGRAQVSRLRCTALRHAIRRWSLAAIPFCSCHSRCQQHALTICIGRTLCRGLLID